MICYLNPLRGVFMLLYLTIQQLDLTIQQLYSNS